MLCYNIYLSKTVERRICKSKKTKPIVYGLKFRRNDDESGREFVYRLRFVRKDCSRLLLPDGGGKIRRKKGRGQK